MEKIFLLKALNLAKIRKGFTSPNPAVGAIVVKNNTVIGSGHHWAVGHPHAEQEVLTQLAGKAEGAELYVTLEPCCHWGKTPPCTDLIKKYKIAKVYFGFCDPNPQVAGRSSMILANAGIQSIHVPIPEIDRFYRSYYYHLKHRRPWVTAKLAISLDGKIAGQNGMPVKLTNSAINKITHAKRLSADAILTTAKTVNMDNPQLNVRLGQKQVAKPIYMLDSQLSLKDHLQIYQTAAQITLFHSKTANINRREQLTRRGIQCVEIAEDKQGLRLSEALYYIGKEGKQELWVEAGSQCLQSLLQHNLVNNVVLYIANKQLGEDAYPACLEQNELLAKSKSCQWQQIDSDLMCEIDY